MWVGEEVEVMVVGRLVVGCGCVQVDIECRMLNKKNKQKEVDMCAKKRRC